MANVLVLFAHPRPDRSEINVPMFEVACAVDGVTAVDLYADYPDFNIDIDAEQKRLTEHDVIVFQHPFFWYSAPAIMKEWQDLVLEHGFAYGLHGKALNGKAFMNVTSTGGKATAYTSDGMNGAGLRALLAPFEKTADLCGMRYLAPFVLFGAGRALEEGQLKAHLNAYESLLSALVAGRFDLEKASSVDVLTGNVDDFVLSEGGV